MAAARPAQRDDQGSRHAAGLPAIEELTRRGVNVNITLLFAIERYEEVIDAYLRGLTARAEAGEPIGRDRVRRVVLPLAHRHEGRRAAARGLAAARPRRDRQRARGLPALPGQVRRPGVGAPRGSRRQAQRPLWASTGTKNPDYSDVLYVAELIGPDVINTMPEQTLQAFADHGEVARRSTPIPQAPSRRSPKPRGRDRPRDVTAELEREGVQSFCDSYRELLDCIEGKLGALAGLLARWLSDAVSHLASNSPRTAALLCLRSRAAYRIVTVPSAGHAHAGPRDLVSVAGKLLPIASAELPKPLGNVVKPLTQSVAGGQLACPAGPVARVHGRHHAATRGRSAPGIHHQAPQDRRSA